MTKRSRRKGSSKAGRPRKEGPRYASGKLKAAGPNQLTLERRRELAADHTMATNPLDVAFTNGWLGLADYATAGVYAALHRQAGLGAPVLGAAKDHSSDIGIEVSDRPWGQMSREEIAAVWDSAFDDVVSAEDKERAQEAAMKRWKLAAAAMSGPQRAEVDLVVLRQSWPQWIVQRIAGQSIRQRAEAEKRGLTDEEQARLAQRFGSAFEARRDLLIAGLCAIRKALRVPERPGPAPATPIIPPGQKPKTPRWAQRTEKTTYVDEDGVVVRQATRRVRI